MYQFNSMSVQMNGAGQASEVAHEAVGREMRSVINFQSRMSCVEKEVAERQEQLAKAEKDRRQGRRDCAARKQANLETFLLRNFGSVLIFAIVCLLDVFCVMDFVWCMAIMALVFLHLVANFIAYLTRNQKAPQKKGNVECA